MNKKEPSYIIAIGASAGGMEEINTFFEHTPLDGVAYVIVQHFSSDFKSRMVELLSKHSRLEVKEAQQGAEICTNIVYLIPNDKFMTTKNNRLFLTAKDEMKVPHLTINTFFNSLAEDNGNKAIAVVLSGMGSDGSEGIIAIKEAGGMVIARNPESSKFSSMPSQAIATDMVDFILEPEFMPEAIESYIKHNDEILEANKMDDKIITEIVAYIGEKLPFDFSDYKMTTILRRTKRRAASSNIFDLAKYLEFLKSNPDEIKALAKDFLISVTSFFRDPEAFIEIQKKVLPGLLKNLRPNEEIKIWVAGCATGEEAYSMAIIIHEALEAANQETIVKIFATDIDTAALQYAGKGIYSPDRTTNISTERLQKYFTPVDGNYHVRPKIRKMLIFAQHDLVKNPPYCNMQFISCRNLLIYMAPVLQKKVFNMLLFGLKMDSYLFLGSSENPLAIIESLEVINKKWRIFKCIKNKREVNFDTFVLPEMLEVRRSAPSSKVITFQNMGGSLAEIVNTELALDTDCLAVCVTTDNVVVKSYGNTAKYLLQQNFNTNLVELLPKSLAVAYNKVSKEALEKDRRVHVKDILLKHEGKMMNISLSVCPISFEFDQQKGLIVIFKDLKSIDLGQQSYPVFDEILYNAKYTEKLEEELKEIKLKLQLSHDKLDASNENMQSFNEELISANEEMQSTNEEMQSVNEELHTINADYQLKNKELVAINDDLNNYFRSNVNGQLFVDNELRLMKFSPSAVKHINLLETDIGRSIGHLSTNIKLETIIEDAKQVLQVGEVISREIESVDGKWYQVIIMPYIQSDNSRNGAIISFNDITELKNAQLELYKKNQILVRINNDLDHFIHTASHDLLAPLGNIEASIEMLSSLEIPDTDFREFVEIIDKSIKIFRSLIKDIATIAKVENDMTLPSAVDLNEILDNIEWSLKDRIDHSGTCIVRSLEHDTIFFSKKNIRSILFNLISNAIKFKGSKPPIISIKTFIEEEYYILTIEDNGKGIGNDSLGKIFNMYGRLQKDIEGSGIGLYLAQKIINAAGGKIVVESKLNAGTKFTIYLKEATVEANEQMLQEKNSVTGKV